jgi:hypothetical protein
MVHIVRIVPVRNPREKREWQHRECRGLVAGFDDGDAGAVADQQPCSGPCAGDGNTDPQPAIRGSPPQLVRNGLRVAE